MLRCRAAALAGPLCVWPRIVPAGFIRSMRDRPVKPTHGAARQAWKLATSRSCRRCPCSLTVAIGPSRRPRRRMSNLGIARAFIR